MLLRNSLFFFLIFHVCPQAGKQIEYLTGGHVLAGFHEVIVAPSTVETIRARKAEGKSLWRVSSTCFGHIQSDQVLEPLPPFASEEAKHKFPPKFTGDQVCEWIRWGGGYICLVRVLGMSNQMSFSPLFAWINLVCHELCTSICRCAGSLCSFPYSRFTPPCV